MKDAYDILMDPKKRKVYDTYGIEMVQMMNGNTDDMSPEVFWKILSRVGLMPRLFVIFVVTCILGAFLLPSSECALFSH
jgi:curved DNA-binding protein CbpA